MQKLLFLIIVLLLAGSSAMATAQTSEPRPAAPATSDGSGAFPLDDKFYNDNFVLSWAQMNGVGAMSMTFVNIDDRLQRNKQIFTKAGYDTFVSDLAESGMIQLVKESRVIISVGTTKPPRIIDQGVVEGRYRWVVEMPIYLYMSNNKTNVTDHMKLTMFIVRSNEPQLKDAIGIEHWLTELTRSPYEKVVPAN